MLIRVVKVGGAYLTDPGWLKRFGRAMASYGPAVIVHGGGTAISARQLELGIPVTKRDGIRYTSPELAEVVQEVLCGPVRDGILVALENAGVRPVGVAGLDGFLEVELIDPERMGAVGQVVSVDNSALEALIEAGQTPVLAPVSRGADGQLVNVNADVAASAVAHSLQADELVLISDVEGVTRRGSVLSTLCSAEIDHMISTGEIRDGMVAKLAAARSSGVPARIGDLNCLHAHLSGTMILPEANALVNA
jgi:acetylglutamate kinase